MAVSPEIGSFDACLGSRVCVSEALGSTGGFFICWSVKEVHTVHKQGADFVRRLRDCGLLSPYWDLGGAFEALLE